MNINDLERCKAATEYDGCWICRKCDKITHYKTKAYYLPGKSQALCRACAEKACSKIK